MEKSRKAEREEEVIRAYQNQEIHLSEAARLLDMDIFDFLRFLSEKNMTLNVSLEDWLGSSSI
jgi:predicted HTH domain antitoxin